MTPVRSALHRVWTDYLVMLRYERINQRQFLLVGLIAQLLTGSGVAVMYGFYLGDLPPDGRAFLVSGVPTLALFPLGFILIPTTVASLRGNGTYDYVWSLPVSRFSAAAATFTVFTVMALPGTVLALMASTVLQGVHLTPNPAIIPAVALAAATATTIGYAIGHALDNPRSVTLLVNLLVFVVLMFSPIVVPIDRFPGWLADVHRVLPFWHMANIIRAGLTDGPAVTGSYLVTIAWLGSALAVAAWVVGRPRQ